MKPTAIWNCTSKKQYASKDEADRTAEYLSQEKGIELSSYKCNVCESYHLTSRTKANK